MRVLVVDDDDVIRQLITLNLELEGFEVHEAVDGAGRLAQGRARSTPRRHAGHHDAQPGRLGRGGAAAQRPGDGARQGGAAVGAGQEADVRRGTRLGVDAYLTKPFDPDDLIDVVRRLAGLPSLRQLSGKPAVGGHARR